MNNVGINKATCDCGHECKLEPVEAEDTEFSRVFAGSCANCGVDHYYKAINIMLEAEARAAEVKAAESVALPPPRLSR